MSGPCPAVYEGYKTYQCDRRSNHGGRHHTKVSDGSGLSDVWWSETTLTTATESKGTDA